MTQLMTPGAGYSRGPDRPAGAATGAVAVLAGPMPGPDQIKDLLAERLMPTSSSDIPPHVHRAALPVPGDDSELFRAIAHTVERPVDPDGPPWECWIIEGLRNDRWAILIKIGQELAEHLSPAQLLARLCDNADHGDFTDSAAAQAGSPSHSPGWAHSMWQAAARAVDGLSAATGALRAWPAGGTPPTMRRYRTVVVPRDDVDRIARKFGVRADDVALAAITEGFRATLLQQGNAPQAVPTAGTTLTHLPVEHHDPLMQLRAVHTRAGLRPASVSASALCAKLFHALVRSSQQMVAVSTTPPGPRYPLRLMGRGLERLLPIPPTAPDHHTGVAVVSYADDVVFGITTDYDTTPDVLAAGINSGMARLVAAGRDSVVLFDRRRKRRARALPNSAARWRPSVPPARVRH